VKKKTMVVASEILGSGSDELGAQLMGSFLRKLCAEATKPERILFYNSGVKLLAEGSAVLDALELLGQAGVDLVACGTCVGYYDLKDKMRVGRVGDMVEIVSRIMNADTVATV
jgi:selenium metabolism protein YedF